MPQFWGCGSVLAPGSSTWAFVQQSRRVFFGIIMIEIDDLIYNPKTGDFYRKHKKFWKKAGSKNKILGYVQIGFKGKTYYAHRLAWFCVHGEWPKDEIDHIDHNRSNNCWNNLRSVSRTENKRNLNLNSNNTSGQTGVYRLGSSWVSQINDGEKTIHIGSFQSKCDAIKARREAEIIYNYHENHGKSLEVT